jgi:hypothetical protein
MDPESSTTISSAHFTLSSVRDRFASSFSVMMTTERLKQTMLTASGGGWKQKGRRTSHDNPAGASPAFRQVRQNETRHVLYGLAASLDRIADSFLRR